MRQVNRKGKKYRLGALPYLDTVFDEMFNKSQRSLIQLPKFYAMFVTYCAIGFCLVTHVTHNTGQVDIMVKGGRAEWHLLKLKSTVIPAKARIHMHQWWPLLWIPAFAGMTINVFCENSLPK